MTLTPSSYSQYLQVNPNGSIRFTPDISVFGPVRFSYQVTDSGGLSATAEVSVDVSLKHPIVYVADDDTNLVTEVYFSDGVTRRKLNSALQQGESISEFRLARAAGVAVFVQRSSGLVLTGLRSDQAPRVVSVPLAAGDFIPWFAVSDDGRHVAYVISNSGVQTLYLADVSGASVVTSTVPLGSVPQTSAVELRFQGTNLTYLRSRQVSTGVFESAVFRVEVSNPAAPVAITRTLTSPQGINGYDVTGNGSQIVYRQTSGFVSELTPAETTIPGSDRRITPPVAPGLQPSVPDFTINPAGNRVYYRLATSGAYFRLYVVDFGSPGVARLLDPDAFPSSSTSIAQIESFRLSRTNERLAVRAIGSGSRGAMTIDGNTGQVQEGITVSTPDFGYAISPDGSQSVYAAERGRVVPWGNPAGWYSFGLLLTTGYHSNAVYSPNGAAVAFIRNQNSRDLFIYNPRPNDGSAKWQTWQISKAPANTRGVSQHEFAAAQPY